MKPLYPLLVFFLSILNLQAQQFTVTGQVVDEQNIGLPGTNIVVKGTQISEVTDFDGNFSIKVKKGQVLVFSFIGYVTKEVKIKNDKPLNIQLKQDTSSLDEEIVLPQNDDTIRIRGVGSMRGYNVQSFLYRETESYAEINENEFKHVKTSPLSTFSVDVDRASYSNIRRMINNGQKVPADAVKIEEMLNYFNYDYPQPQNDEPFSINTEVVQTPWNTDTKLVKIGLQGKNIPVENIPASNLVFLLDVSGSMSNPNKLPLLKSAFKILVNQLREEDKVSIVVYAGAAGEVLQPTNGSNKTTILEALDKLTAGGSTSGGEGINLAYKIAKENFIDGGNNRIILATDGDFNVGASSDKEMEDLIEDKRNEGIFLTCLGFGMGNYKDSKLEILADKGNGNHSYIDSMQEARKVLGTEFGGTLYTIAKDVKIQVEFNPAHVKGYRLIGYENRLLNDEDFNDDKKDAGEKGSGHSVTALYEIIPAGVNSQFLKDVDDLKYTSNVKNNAFGDELLNVKIRYKKPDGNTSKLITKQVMNSDLAVAQATADLNFMASVALFGMHLRESEFANGSTKEEVVRMAESGRGKDAEGYRAEFIRLVKASEVY